MLWEEECFSTTPLACRKAIDPRNFGWYSHLLTPWVRRGLTKSSTEPILTLCHLGKGVSRTLPFPSLGLLAPLAFRTLVACTHTWGEEDLEPVAYPRTWGEGCLTDHLRSRLGRGGFQFQKLANFILITSFYSWEKGFPLNLFTLFALARKRGFTTTF